MKHIMTAVREFAGRYLNLFKAVWAIRATLDPPKRSTDELAFLPAHLELTDTPVSPVPLWTLRIIIALFCVALVWSIFGQLEIVAVAPGKTVVDGRTKVIQPIETSVVRRILVQDGQSVKKGDLLVELDATAEAADYAKAGDSLIDTKLTQLRLAAMAESLDSGKPPVLAPDPLLPADRFTAAQQLATSAVAAYVAKRENLQAAIAQREAELHTAESSIAPLKEAADITVARSADYNKLLAEKYVAKHDFLQREQERIAAERDLTTQQDRIPELRSALDAAREQLSVQVTDTKQQTLDQLRQATEQIHQYAPEVGKTQQRDQLMQLRSPVDGTVQQLAIHTVGGVVTPAQALMSVVPKTQSMEVEATILNRDIGFVRAGQPVVVKVDSFPFTRYGYVTGVVESVSHDAAQDDKLGLIFPARVKLLQSSLVIDGTRVNLTPGMSLSVEVKTGSQRVIQYLLSPLQTHANEAMRER